MGEKILGKDYVVLKNPGLIYNGATSQGDNYVHIGQSLNGGRLLCEGSLENFFLTRGEVKVDCPNCIAKAMGETSD